MPLQTIIPAGGGASPYVPAAYLGVVATRCAIPDSISNSLATTQTARSKHFATENLTSVKLGWANWWADGAEAGATYVEKTPGASASIQAYIEYPINSGTLFQVLFGGSATGTAADGATLISDFLAVNIPQGAPFWVYTWWSSTAGVPTKAYASTTNGGEVTHYPSASIVTGAACTQTAAAYAPPCLILQNTIRPAVAICGDSIAYGQADLFGGQAENSIGIGWAARSLDGTFGYINLASGGDTAFNAGMNYNRRKTLAFYCSHVVAEFGINDFGTLTRTSAQIAADRATFAALFPNQIVIGATIMPGHVSTTDAFATIANQSLPSYDADRKTLNGLIRAGIVGEANVVDIDRAIDPGLLGKWPVTGAANYSTSDGLHPSVAATGIILGGTNLHRKIARTPNRPAVTTASWQGPAGLLGAPLWLDFSDSASITVGTGAASVVNKGDAANPAAQATGAAQPTILSAVQNGHNGLRFTATASQRLLFANRISLGNKWTLFAVVKRAGPSGSNRVEAFGDTLHTGVYAFEWYSDQKIYCQSTVVSQGTIVSAAQADQTNAHVVIVTLNNVAGGAKLFFDGTDISGAATFTNGATAAGVIDCVGFCDTVYANSDMFELAAFNRELPSSEVTALQTYAKAKWGTP